MTPDDVAENWNALRANVTQDGYALVRGLDLREPDDFVGLCRSLPIELMTEREAFAPRSTLGEGVYSSSKWPADQPMCMHHELSYAVRFPGLMLFACLDAPTSGGATALADARAVLADLPADLVDEFERRGWLLTRSYNDEVGISVEEAFGTRDRAAIEVYCREQDIEFEWRADGVLRTRQRRPAVIRHPITGERCWFNQIAFLNEWTMATEVFEYLVDLYGADGLPFTTSFGDGTVIDPDVVELINQVYDKHTVSQPWQPGDLMIVDNIRTAHSRQPYDGNREILVAMGDPRSF